MHLCSCYGAVNAAHVACGAWRGLQQYWCSTSASDVSVLHHRLSGVYWPSSGPHT
jgi:hypothetical protein